MDLSSAASSAVSSLTGNPAFDAAKSIAGSLTTDSKFSSVMNSGTGAERLQFTRPRYTSNDTTFRGSPAYIKLLTQDGATPTFTGSNSAESSTVQESLNLLTSSGSGNGYDKFVVTGISASMQEKLQVTEVFGDSEVVYYFGRAPMTVTLSGALIDSVDNTWFTDWLYTYNFVLRGTKLAQNYQMLKLVLPNMTLTGSITGFTWQQDSANDVQLGFRFDFLVNTLTPLPALPIGAPITDAAQQINFDQIQSFITQTNINSLRAQGASLISTFKNPASTISSVGSALSSFGANLPGNVALAGTSSLASKFIDGLSSSVSNGVGGLNSLLQPITTALSGIRAKLFSPIYGVMNSLTKLVSAVFGASGVSSIFTALTAPIKNMLGDITRIANQATAIANMIESGVQSLGRGVFSGFGAVQAFDQAVQAVSKAAGTIVSLPANIGNDVGSLVRQGIVPYYSPFLQYNPKLTLSRGSTSAAASLGGSGASMSPQMAILSSGALTPPSPSAYI